MDDPFKYGLLAALAIALLTAAFTDLRSRQIGNWLNGAIALGAPLFWWASGLSLWPEVAAQLAVALAAFVVLAGLFALRAMGGGDVKLLTALALWVEPAWFANLQVVMALLGGCWYPSEFFPEAAQLAARALPTAWAMQGLTDLVMRGQGLPAILPEAGVLAAFAVVFFAVGVWRFRYE